LGERHATQERLYDVYLPGNISCNYCTKPGGLGFDKGEAKALIKRREEKDIHGA